MSPLAHESVPFVAVKSEPLRAVPLAKEYAALTALALPPFAIIGYVAGRLSGRAEIVRGWGAYLVLLVATLVVSSSMGAHYTLYARRADRSLMYIQLGSAVLCIAMQSILAPVWGANGAAIATLVSVAAMAFAKYWMASRGTFVARQPEHSA